jgi:AcrR family transcriptional regulator
MALTDDSRGPPEPPARRPRDPDRTKRDILVAAREEFVEFGLDGARIDRIAERAGANKRMLYHYVGNKEALYARVLLDAYREIREGEAELHLGELPPARSATASPPTAFRSGSRPGSPATCRS